MKLLPAALLALAAPAALAQEPGWHYSPYPGEGDRAAMGCARGSTPETHACLVVRCEDDFSVALYLETSRPAGDVGQWTVQIDSTAHELETVSVAAGVPYGGRFTGTGEEIAALVESLKQSAFAFLQPLDEPPPVPGQIGGTGSLYAINQALYFCAPRAGPSTDDGTEQGPDAGGGG